MLFNIISFSNELSVVMLISQFPFIEGAGGRVQRTCRSESIRSC